MTQRPLTEKQKLVLQLVCDHIKDHGYPPTRMDIAKSLGFKSANAAEEHLRALEKKGFIRILNQRSRGIQVIQTSEDSNDTMLSTNRFTFNAANELPVIGRVAAGSPILAEQHIERHISVAASTFQPTADFLLRVQGLSMKDAGILEGDLLAVASTQNVRSGQIIVARINDEVTVKEFKKNTRGNISLLPKNSDFKPIEVDPASDFHIEGLVVGVIRTF